MALIKKFFKKKRGATAIEYAILASLLSAAIIFGVDATGVATKNSYDSSTAKLEDAFEAAAGHK